LAGCAFFGGVQEPRGGLSRLTRLKGLVIDAIFVADAPVLVGGEVLSIPLLTLL